MFRKGQVLFLLLCLSASLAADLTFDNEIRLHVVTSPSEVDCKRSKEILVKSFMDGYEDVPLGELNPLFRSTGDVRRFYEAYFDSEFSHFKDGHLIWVQAFVDGTLAGWATFELEKSEENAVYMNLLTVDPEYQRLGLGSKLTFSICSDELYPNTSAINLLVRKINEDGYKFYYKIGFFDHEYRRDDNFVDTALLLGLRWEKEHSSLKDCE